MTRDSSHPRISFGIIVLNGEPFTRYCLRSLYPFAHEIIVVEGGHEDTRSVANAEGHSLDGTLETLWQFKWEEDPEGKVQIVTRNGFWPKVDELGRCRTHQSRAYAERATGDYLWQVDIDEFYRPEDMRRILAMLVEDPAISVVSFWVHTFWGGLTYTVDGWKRRRGDEFFRLFKWGEGYRYVTHEPPTVHDDRGVDLRSGRWVSGKEMAARGVFLFHYAHLFPRQVRQKSLIYQNEKPEICSEIGGWLRDNYCRLDNPYRVERHYWFPSWLQRYRGGHPPEAQKMMNQIIAGRVGEELRQTSDIEQLLSSKRYAAGRSWFRALDILDRFRHWAELQYQQSRHLVRVVLERVMPRTHRKYYKTSRNSVLDDVLYGPLRRFL